ncbi:MAG: type II toxin-antitoxin system RatA family toxin [Legionellaceae bacterium]|nr:type II toxin-antitoxin system RatA family toxin [Legionellaceae bacterium]
MTIIKRDQQTSYSCEQMYQLVNDIESYSQFLPYCTASVVHHRDEDEVQATLTITAAGMNKSFTTRNRLQANKMIEMRLVDGIFSHLEGFWRFEETAEGCHLFLDLEFEFSSRIVAMMISPMFDQIADKMVEVFCTRAQTIYGK